MLASFSWEHAVIIYTCYLAHRNGAWTTLIMWNTYYNKTDLCLWEIRVN